MWERNSFSNDIDGLAHGKAASSGLSVFFVVLGAIVTATLAALAHFGGARWQAVMFVGILLSIWLLSWVYIRQHFIKLTVFGLSFTLPMILNVGLWEFSGPTASGMPRFMTLWDKDFFLGILLIDLATDWFQHRKRPTASLGWSGIWVLVMFACLWLFPFNTINNTRSFALVIEWSRFLLIFAFLARYVHDRDVLKWIVYGILIQIWLEGGIALAQYATGGKLGLTFLGETRVKEMMMPGGALIRSGALLSHPNAFALWLVLVTPLPLALALNPNYTAARRFMLWTTYAFGLTVLIMTFSRAGWGAAVVGLFATFHMAQRRFGRPLVVSIWLPMMVFAALGLSLYTLSPEVQHRISGDDGGSSFARVPQFITALNIIAHKPFTGTGIGSYAPYIHEYANFDGRYISALFFRVHNGWLLWTAETGIISGLAYLFFWISIAKRGWGCWRIKDDFLALTGLAALVGLGGWWLKSMYNIHTVNNDQSVVLHWALVWIVWNCAGKAEWNRIKGPK